MIQYILVQHHMDIHGHIHIHLLLRIHTLHLIRDQDHWNKEGKSVKDIINIFNLFEFIFRICGPVWQGTCMQDQNCPDGFRCRQKYKYKHNEKENECFDTK